MSRERKQDLFFALLLSAPIIITFMMVGDPLFLGWWYYTLVLSLPLVISFIIRTEAFFLTGISFSANLCLWCYWIFCLNHNFEGLLGLGHFFSLPFWGVGWLIAAILLKFTRQGTSRAFWSGFLLPTFGFIFAQGFFYFFL